MLDPHDHDACIQQALDDAERICRERGARLTEQRRRVLELIWRNHDVVTAYELLGALRVDDPGAKPMTVYRALDFLLQHGLAHRIESVNGYTRCEDPPATESCQFLICDRCGLVEEFHDEPLMGTGLGAGEDQDLIH
ncbi:MAG: Fur family transcriptional regulator, partial [Gammaproteobacteria bacterium]